MLRLLAGLRFVGRRLIRPKGVENELNQEFQYHLEREIQAGLRAGLTPEEARYAAMRTMGAVEKSKEECRDMRRINWIDNTLRDFRYAIRQLRKSPGFACTATSVLALGISAAICIFGLVEAALIKPLPYRDQTRLVGAFAAAPNNPRCPLPISRSAPRPRLICRRSLKSTTRPFPVAWSRLISIR